VEASVQADGLAVRLLVEAIKRNPRHRDSSLPSAG
jgi:hypothetical protein